MDAAIVLKSHYRNAKSTHMHMLPARNHRDLPGSRVRISGKIRATHLSLQFADIGIPEINNKRNAHLHVVNDSCQEYGLQRRSAERQGHAIYL